MVDGYIRGLKQLLSDDTIIPNDVIALCQLFFITNNKLFIHVLDTDAFKGHTYLLDVETKQIFKLKSIECDKGQDNVISSNHSFCHIQNINANSKAYDGLIYFENRFAVDTNEPGLW